MHRQKLIAIAFALSSAIVPTIAAAQPVRPDRDGRDDWSDRAGNGPPDGQRPSSPRRELWQLQRELGEKLDVLDDLQTRSLDLLSRPVNSRRHRALKDITRRTIEVSRDLRLLQSDLRDALRDLGYEHGPRDPHRPSERPPLPVVRVPEPLRPAQFAFLVKTVDDATFPDHQMNALRDAINTGAWFDIAQARTLLDRFAHESHKVDVGGLLCPRIVEPGALPHLLATFTFESYRQQLRERTNNQCGWMP